MRNFYILKKRKFSAVLTLLSKERSRPVQACPTCDMFFVLFGLFPRVVLGSRVPSYRTTGIAVGRTRERPLRSAPAQYFMSVSRTVVLYVFTELGPRLSVGMGFRQPCAVSLSVLFHE